MTMNDAAVTPSSPQRRRRFMVILAFVVLFVAASCGGDSTASADSASQEPVVDAPAASEPEATVSGAEAPEAPAPVEEPTAAPADEPTPAPTPTPHPIAVADTELPPAPIGFESLFDDVSGPQPVSIEIEDIGVRSAEVIPVGVNEEDLSFEVPPADQVGWYEFGPAPGEPGSSVLAAHIAYNGVDGVFRYLEDVEVGAIVVIGFDDGSTARYRIEEVTEYVKEALPDSLFDRSGDQQLALITCGGAFNYQLDSYESNTVAIAVPLEA